jgi:glutamyl-tRNA reductase
VPRDIEAGVQQLDNVYVYDVDDLEVVVREHRRHREAELAQCQAIIAERVREIEARFAARPVARENLHDGGESDFGVFGTAWLGSRSF